MKNFLIIMLGMAIVTAVYIALGMFEPHMIHTILGYVGGAGVVTFYNWVDNI